MASGLMAGCSGHLISFNAEPAYGTQAYSSTYSPAQYGYTPTQTYSPAPSSVVVTPQNQVAQGPTLPTDQLNDLTASIALYPDPLLAVMLPAATYPDQIVSANQWLATHPNPDDFAIEQLPYADSVKSLMHYPTVLQMMAEHPDWTQALGLAFVYQQPDVMNSIQYWRATAQADGTLYSTPQQQVVAGPQIEILPAAPDIVYVPQYDPAVVFVRHPYHDRDFIRFQAAGHGRQWLDHDMDWHNHVVRVPDHRDFAQRPGRVVVTPDRRNEQRNEQLDRRDLNQRQARNDNNRNDNANDNRRVFTRNDMPRDRNFPQRIVTPTPDHKVITPQPRVAQDGNPRRTEPRREPGQRDMRDLRDGEANGR
jgi:hypothetical protein